MNAKRPQKLFGAAAIAGLLLGAVPAVGQDGGEMTVSALALQQAEAAVRVATLERDLKRSRLEAAAVREESGLQAMDVGIASGELVTAERKLAAAQLDFDEVTASGRPARREITAPRVGGRDFVSERWQMELGWIESAAPALDERARLAGLRVRAGVGDAAELTRTALDRERFEAAAEKVRALLSLRGRFLAGEIGAEETELAVQVLTEAERERVLRAELARMQAGNGTVQ